MKTSSKYDREYAGEGDHSFAGDKHLIRRLLKYLKPYRKLLAFAVCLLFVSKMTEASVPFFIGKLTKKILDNAGFDGMQQTEMLPMVLKGGFFILALLVCCYLLDGINAAIKGWIGQNGLYRLRMDVYGHVIRMPLAYFDRSSVGRLMTRTIHDVDQINQMFVDSVVPILGNFFLFAGVLIAILIMDWRIALLVSFILPFVWWLTCRFRKFQGKCFNRTRTVESAMNTFVQEHLMGAAIVRNFGLHAQARKQFEEINEDFCRAQMASIDIFSFFIAGIDFIQNASLVLAFVLIVVFPPFNGEFDAGIYFSYSLYSLMFFRPLADLAERYNALQSAMSSASRIFDLLDEQTECLEPVFKLKRSPESHESSRGWNRGFDAIHRPLEFENSLLADKSKIELSEIESIFFDDVWFCYEDQNWVLKGLSIEIHKGHSYGIVGMTGEGKSTMISLLLRFYEPKKGKILVNGRDIRSYSLDSLRRQFGLVLQDPVIFSGTLGENISLFDESMERKVIENTIDYLGIRSFVKNFSEGLDHKLQSQGKGLSAGEMQLISLARAVSQSRPVLILDEATASIDTMTEHMMQKALHTVLKKQTSLVIAHRLSTVKDIGHIIVLQGGRIVEIGNHQALIEKKRGLRKTLSLAIFQ